MGFVCDNFIFFKTPVERYEIFCHAILLGECRWLKGTWMHWAPLDKDLLVFANFKLIVLFQESHLTTKKSDNFTGISPASYFATPGNPYHLSSHLSSQTSPQATQQVIHNI